MSSSAGAVVRNDHRRLVQRRLTSPYASHVSSPGPDPGPELRHRNGGACRPGVGHGARDGDDGRRHDARLRSEEHTSELQSLMRISYAVLCLQKTTLDTETTKPHEHP